MASADALIRLLLNTSDFDSKLVKSKKNVGDLKGGMGALQNILKGAVGSLAKFAGGLSAGAMACKVAKDAFMSMESNIDEWGRTVEGAKGAYDIFLDTINGGDWSNFFSNLETAVQGARDLYDALDRLGSVKANNASAIAIKQQEIQTLRLRKQSTTNKKELAEINAKIQQATSELARLQGESVGAGKNAGRASIKNTIRNAYLGTEGANGKINNKTLEWVTSQILTRGQGFYDEERAIYNRLKRKGTKTTTSSYTSSTGQTYTTTKTAFDINSLNVADRYKYLWAKAITESETAIQQGAQIYTQAIQEETANTREQFRNNRYRLSGSSSGSGSKKTEAVYTANAVSAKQMSDNVTILKKKLDELTPGTTEYNKVLLELVNTQDRLNQLQAIESNTMDRLTKSRTAVSINPESRFDNLDFSGIGDTLSSEQDGTSDIFEKMFTEKATNHIKKQIKEIVDGGKDVGNTWQTAASAIAQCGSALQGVGDKGVNVAGIVMQAVANIALGFAQAAAGEGKSGNVWEWIAAAVSGTATMIATIASIHSATGYAEGGVVGGNSYSGDRLYARLNSGEVVLNQNQIARANSMLDNSGGARTVTRGEQLVQTINAWGRRTGRGEILK